MNLKTTIVNRRHFNTRTGTSALPTRRTAERGSALLCLLLLVGCATQQVTPPRSNTDIILRYFDQWANHADVRAADELIATNVVLRHPHVTVTGLETYKQSMAVFHTAFPDLHFAIEDLVAQVDKVLVRWQLTGTQRGDFQGHAASGKGIRVAGMSLFRLANGKIQEIWVNQDRLGMQQQLGWLAAAAPTNAVPSPAYHELRIYTVTSNKLAGVLERFRDTVEPVRRKHGISTLGYWSAAGTTNGGTFAYLMAAASKEELQKQEKDFGADPDFQKGYAASNEKHGKTVDKIVALALAADATAKLDFTPAKTPRAFDLRIYSVLPGKLDAFRNRWRDFAVPIYERHGLHGIGWWVAEQKHADGNDQFVCLLAGESIPAILKSISEFHQDADWIRVENDTEAAGKLRSGVTAYKLTPTDFSACK